jgi:hypothetical protein
MAVNSGKTAIFLNGLYHEELPRRYCLQSPLQPHERRGPERRLLRSYDSKSRRGRSTDSTNKSDRIPSSKSSRKPQLTKNETIPEFSLE